MVGGGLWVILLLDCHSDTRIPNLLSIPRVQHFITRICQLKVFYLCPLPMIIPFCFFISYSVSFFRSYFGCLSHVISTSNISYPSPFFTLFVLRIFPTFAFYSHPPVFFISYRLLFLSLLSLISSAHMAFPSPFFALFSTRITPTFVSALVHNIRLPLLHFSPTSFALSYFGCLPLISSTQDTAHPNPFLLVQSSFTPGLISLSPTFFCLPIHYTCSLLLSFSTYNMFLFVLSSVSSCSYQFIPQSSSLR